MKFGIVSCLVLVVAVVGCSSPVTPPEFDGGRAFSNLEAQVALGPRVPGTEASARCRDLCYRHFDSCGLEIDSQPFVVFDPYTSVDTPMVNVIARYRGRPSDGKAILLLAHYDSRPRTDYHSDSTLRYLPIDGANDGASGVAVLMELANLLAERPADCNLDIVLSDGEDWGKSGDIDRYLLGAREFARHGIRDRYHFAIVVDMIGDAFQQIYREDYTEQFYKPVNDMIWQVAAHQSVATFIDDIRHTIQDDHVPLGAAGVPTALLIDFDYPHWHTERDTPDKCSAQSLANVGRVLAYIIYNRSLWPTR
jgi:Zn-dependent M28 family amino/carboxypeptidase